MNNYGDEFDALQKRYERASKEAQKLAKPLLDEAKFQAKQLKKLRKDIEGTGWTSVYHHGYKQGGITQSAAGKTYLTLIKCFNTTMKTLYSVLDVSKPEPPSELSRFLNDKREIR